VKGASATFAIQDEVKSDTANIDASSPNKETNEPNLHDEKYAPRLGLPILLGMNKLEKPMFGGITKPGQFTNLMNRRAKNKVAARSRRINRLRAK